jgi:hypothetical protein
MKTGKQYIGETAAVFVLGLQNALNTIRRRKAIKHIQIAARALNSAHDIIPIQSLAQIATALGMQALYDAEQYHAAIQRHATELAKEKE